MAMPAPTRAPSLVVDPYDYDQPYNTSHRRSRRHSTSTPVMIQTQQPSMGGIPNVVQAGTHSPYPGGHSPIPIPGRTGSASAYSGGLGTTPTYPPPVAGSAGYPGSSPYGIGAAAAPSYVPTGNMPYAGPASYGAGGLSQSYTAGSALGGHSPVVPQTIPGQYGAAQPGVQYVSQPGTSYGAGYGAGGAYPGSSSSIRPAQAIPGAGYNTAYGGTVIPAQPGQTIVIKSRPRRHSSSHRHHRPRSVDYAYERY